MARKAVRNISVSIGSVTGLALASAPAWAGGSSVEGDKIAAYGDTGFTTVPRNVKSYPEAEFSFIDEGDGKATDTTVSASVDMAILSCEPGDSIDVDGDRKATFTVKAVRHAPPAATQSNS